MKDEETTFSTSAHRNKRRLGTEYEQLCAEYLTSKGYRVLDLNFRCRIGEIDVVALDGNVLVFVEVKYRSGTGSGSSLEAVDRRKQMKICRTADFYLMQLRFDPRLHKVQMYRFDVFGIERAASSGCGSAALTVCHITDAFPYTAPGGFGRISPL